MKVFPEVATENIAGIVHDTFRNNGIHEAHPRRESEPSTPLVGNILKALVKREYLLYHINSS
jgi:hypothetical protein